MPKYNFNKFATLWHECSPVNLLHIFRTPFPENISVELLLLLKMKMANHFAIKENAKAKTSTKTLE